MRKESAAKIAIVLTAFLRHLDASTQPAGPHPGHLRRPQGHGGQNHRSMQEQARLLIEREVRLHQPGAMERARSMRSRMRERPMPQLLEDLCADRER